MKHQITSLSRLLGAAAFSVLVAACSGGGGGGSSGGSAVPQDIFRITCTVLEAGTRAPVDNASVIFNGKGADSIQTQTDKDGKCILNVPAADVQTAAGDTLTFPAASVVKDGFEPSTVVCENAKTGTACDQEVLLVRITTNTSLPENGDVVTHVGDGIFDGQINSQFQKNPEAVQPVDFRIADWGTKLLAHPEWTRATVVLDAKGWQTAICNNTVAILGSAGSPSQPGGNSDVDGGWSVLKFEFDVAEVGRSGAATLRIASGNCGGKVDIDDVETNRIRVYYCAATPVGPCTRQEP